MIVAFTRTQTHYCNNIAVGVVFKYTREMLHEIMSKEDYRFIACHSAFPIMSPGRCHMIHQVIMIKFKSSSCLHDSSVIMHKFFKPPPK